MIDIVSPFLKIIKVKTLNTDNNVFKLHYKITMFVLLIFSTLLTQKQYFGDPIDCTSNSDLNNDEYLDTFCWIQSTYTIPSIKGSGAHAGVGPHPRRDGHEPEIKHHMYYQWVTLFMYLQAIMFYIPRYLWTIWEGGRLKMLIDGLQLPITDKEEVDAKKSYLITYLKLNYGKQKKYAFKFIVCEALNLINVVVQILITDAFLGYEFSSYGMKLIKETQKTFYSRTDELEYVFPKVSKCLYTNYGPSGTRQFHDVLCVLPLNVLNEKIFIFIWFWLLAIATVTSLSIVYRCATFSLPFRSWAFKLRAKLSSKEDVDAILEKCDYGDWFFLYQICKNMDALILKDFITQLAREIQCN